MMLLTCPNESISPHATSMSITSGKSRSIDRSFKDVSLCDVTARIPRRLLEPFVLLERLRLLHAEERHRLITETPLLSLAGKLMIERVLHAENVREGHFHPVLDDPI